ncbi:MAG: aldehyde dehydrogenase family protein, partial [Gammaproteobacteria bacterium]
MSEVRPLLVENAPPPAGTMPVTAPFDGRLLAEVEVGDGRHVAAALACAHAVFRNRDAWLPLHERVGILERTAVIMESRRDALALEAALEGGKPLADSR